MCVLSFFFFSSRRRHTRLQGDWSSDVCSSDLSWLRWMVELDNPFAASNKAAFIVRQLQIQPGMKVLDAGCGPGRVTLPLARAVGAQGQVLAVDLQPAMLEQVAAKARTQGLENVRTQAAALGQGQLEAQQHDRAVMAAVLGEIPDRQAALADVFQSLRPGGLLAVAELVFDPHFQRRTSVEKLAGEAGFKIGRASCRGRV